MCEHNENSSPFRFALLIAFMEIIPHFSPIGIYIFITLQFPLSRPGAPVDQLKAEDGIPDAPLFKYEADYLL